MHKIKFKNKYYNISVFVILDITGKIYHLKTLKILFNTVKIYFKHGYLYSV